MADFTSKVSYVSKNIDAKDRIKLKDTTNAMKIDEMVNDGTLRISVDYYAVISIHNEKADPKDYEQILIVDRDGQKFVTGSPSFRRSLSDIIADLDEAGITEYELDCYKRPSKNYSGKYYLTCSLV